MSNALWFVAGVVVGVVATIVFVDRRATRVVEFRDESGRTVTKMPLRTILERAVVTLPGGYIPRSRDRDI